MQPLQYDLRCPAAKDTSITHAAAASRNLDVASHYNAICRDQVAKHNRTTRNGVGNCSSKTGSRRQSEKKDDFEAPFKRKFEGKIASTKIEEYADITVAALMQPLQYDLRCPAAKDTSITHSAAAPRNLDAAITMRSAETELRNTLELRATASKIAAPKPDLDAKAKKKTIFEHLQKEF